MFDFISYTEVAGAKTTPDITVYALSTCGFCRRGMSFLQNNGFKYRYVHMDLVPLETKNDVKARLKLQFKEEVAFPFIVIDESDFLVGFIEPDWKKTLGVE